MSTPNSTTTPDRPPSSTATNNGKLLSVLGLPFGVAVTVGGCIGVGILSQPGTVAKHLPHPALFLTAWILGGAYTFFGAVSVAELAAMTPRSGGFYVYVRRALGPYPGFITGWGSWLALCCGEAMIVAIFAQYLVLLIPAFAGWNLFIGVATVVCFTISQWPGIRGSGKIQEATTLLKGIAFLVLILGLVLVGRPSVDVAPKTLTSLTGMSLLTAGVLAFQAVLMTYDGWEGAIFFGEEVSDPGRTLPRSLFIGIATIVFVYVSLNVALLYVLPIEHLSGHPFAVRAAASQAFGPTGAGLVAVLATASVLVTCNAATLQAPRVLYAMSCDALFHPCASKVNAGGTPFVALLLSSLVVLFLLVTGSFEQLLSVLAFFLVTNYGLLFTSVFVLRKREPATHRPYKVWGYPWTTTAALLGSLTYLAAAVATDTIHFGAAILLLVASRPLYTLMK